MANLFDVIIKAVPLTAQQPVTVVLAEMLGPDAANKINQLLNNGGLALSKLNEQAATIFAAKLSDAGATVSIEANDNTLALFRVRLLSFGRQRLQVIKQVKGITGLGLKESKELVDRNGVVKDNLHEPAAAKIKQKLSNVGATAVIEAMLSSDDEKKKEGSKVPRLSDDGYLITGRVRLVNGEPAIGVLVRAYDKDLRNEQELGEGSTLANGEYAVAYQQSQFSRSEKNNADLLLRVFNEVGVELALKTKNEDEPDVLFNSPKKIEVDLQILESDSIKASEYERLEGLLTPALDGVTLADLSQQDINFLINETEIREFSDEFPSGANSIHFIAQSAKRSSETSIPVDAFYGWARMGFGLLLNEETDQLTLNLNALLEQSNKQLKNALEQAIEGSITPVWSTEQLDSNIKQVQSLRDEKVQEERKLWTQHQVRGVLLDAENAEPLDGYFVSAEISQQDNRLNIERNTTNELGEFVVTYELPPEQAISTHTLLLHIEDAKGETRDKQEVSVAVDQVQPVTIKITVPVQAELGEDALLEALPMSFSSGLNRVLETNNLRNIAALRKVGGLSKLVGLPKSLQGSDEIKELQAHVDLSLLSTDLKPEKQMAQNQFLIKKGINSVHDIADMSVERYVSKIGDKGLVSPALQHAQATYLDFQLSSAFLNTQIDNVDKTEEPEQDTALNCQCEDCVSAISPGAYLADLIAYVTKHVDVTDSNNRTNSIDLDFLVDKFHQPLSKLPINCEATKTQVRQVRIACEVLYSDLSPSDLAASVNSEGVIHYRKKAYQLLLRNIGTSSSALQRASSIEEIKSIANRIGIAPEHVQAMQDQDNAFNHVLAEETLESLFGMPAFVEQANAKLLDPLRYLNKQQTPPLLYNWKLERIQQQWKDADFPKSPLTENTPIIDPDLIGPDDFRHPEEANKAFKLWQTRREWLDEQIARIHVAVTSGSNSPNGLEAAISEISVPTTIDDVLVQQGLLTNDAKAINSEPFLKWLAKRHLTVEALAELARFATGVKAGTAYNDEQWKAYVTTATKILAGSVKKAAYESWILEEDNLSVKMAVFWPSLTEPKQGEWSLFLEDQKPLIDPEKIEPKDLPDDKFGFNARKLWGERRKVLDEKQKEYVDILKSKSANRLSKIMTSAFGSVPNIEEINTKLKSLDLTEQSDAKAQILALNFGEGSFESLVSASLILEDTNQVLSDTVQNNLAAALVSAHKLNSLYSNWADDELDLPYWQLLKARLPKWQTSAEQRQQWQQALKQSSKAPLIDPDIISGDALLEPVVGDFAFDTWRSRFQLIEAELGAIRNRIERGGNVIADVINPNAAKELLSEKKYLGLSHESLIALSELEKEGLSINSRLQQIALTREAYLFLLEVSKRIVKGSKVLPATRENMYSILLQVWKVKQFSTWTEEEKNELSLSPEFFKHPKQKRALIAQEDARKWRVDTRRQREWLGTLSSRIEQQKALASSLRTAVSDVEEQTLPALRNALIEIVDTTDDVIHIKAENLSKRLLTGMQLSGCQMTTRVSIALELLQTLVFSIRSGALDISDAKLGLSSKQFEKEWKWMGSYATWKAAMGVFLYPEQVLYPSLRRDKTPLLRSIEESLNSDVSFDNVCEKASIYSDYMKDLVSMQPLASCDARVTVSDGEKCAKKTKESNDLFFVFAQGRQTKQYYWSSMDQHKVNGYTQSYWHTIPIPENTRIKKLIGASSIYTMGKETNDIYVFFEAYEKNSYAKKVIYFIFDSDNYMFLPELNEVSLPEKSYESSSLIQYGSRPALLIRYAESLGVSEFNGGGWSHYQLENILSYLDSKYRDGSDRLSSHPSGFYIDSSITLYSAQKIRSSKYRKELLNIVIAKEFPNGTYSKSGRHFFSLQLALSNKAGKKNVYTPFLLESMSAKPNDTKKIPILSFVTASFSNNSTITKIHTLFRENKELTRYSTIVDSDVNVITNKHEDLKRTLEPNNNYAIPNSRFTSGVTTLAYSNVQEKEPIHSAYRGVFSVDNKKLVQTVKRLITLKGNPERLPEIVSRDKMEDLTRLHYIESFHRVNYQTTHPSHKVISHGRHYKYLEEAYFFLPLQIALSLHKKQRFSDALLWFRSVFDFQLSGRSRRLAYTLSKEASSASNLGRPNDWVIDPLNPHGTHRSNKYTSFTVQNISRCLLDYADSEFTNDTSESIARAKNLYASALDLIQSELPPQAIDRCQALIDSITFEAEDASLQPYYQHLENRLSEITQTGLLKKACAEIKSALTTNLNEEKRLAAALQIIKLTLGEKKIELNASDIISNSIIKRAEISRSLLSGLSHNLSVDRFFSAALNVPLSANSRRNTTVEIDSTEIEDFSTVVIEYTPKLSYGFCIPENPTSRFLSLRAELNLFKIRNCMNIAGMKRELEPYAAPVGVESALPSMGAGGQINMAGVTRIRPTQYRYPVLVDRAKQLTNLAQQTEASFFNSLQSLGQETYSLLKARQDVELSREGVKLQTLRVTESEGGVALAESQLERTTILAETYDAWSNENKLSLEQELLDAYKAASDFQRAASALRYITQGSQISASLASSWKEMGATTAFYGLALGSTIAEGVIDQFAITKQLDIQTLSLNISIALRNREYELQNQLAEQDLEIGNQQIKLANDRVHITEQEHAISEIQSEQAADTVVFLQEKFTNVELYDWMSGVLENIFRYYLQQASSMSKLAEIQLAFERQEPLVGVIKNDYYELPNNDGNDSASSHSSSIDRRGLTGSGRLLQDITKLDQHAFQTDQRKQQLSINFSLSQLDPLAFEKFKQTGILNFDTPSKLFDRRFPGQYLRLIKRVRISIIALVPPVQGISATLTSSGISRVVIAGDVFQTSVIRRDSESIAFTNSVGASGVFELNPNPEMLFPFEGNGVDTRWEFRLPKASNPMDFNTIADVLLTVEYTALHNRTYQEQVQRELDTHTRFDRAFSLRQEFSDAWYDLHNPEQTDSPMSVRFETTLADFPSNMKELSIGSVLMYIIAEDDLPQIFSVNLFFTQDSGTSGGEASPIDGVIRSNSNGANWASISGKVPEGTWQLQFPNVSAIKQLFEGEKISDILLVLTCDGELPEY